MLEADWEMGHMRDERQAAELEDLKADPQVAFKALCLFLTMFHFIQIIDLLSVPAALSDHEPVFPEETSLT